MGKWTKEDIENFKLSGAKATGMDKEKYVLKFCAEFTDKSGDTWVQSWEMNEIPELTKKEFPELTEVFFGIYANVRTVSGRYDQHPIKDYKVYSDAVKALELMIKGIPT